MFTLDVNCPKCEKYFKYECEYESAGEGSTHDTKCECGANFEFEIEYFPSASDERIIEES